MSNKKIQVTWQKNVYDSDGDVSKECILLWINGLFCINLNDIRELDSFTDQLIKIKYEILSEG